MNNKRIKFLNKFYLLSGNNRSTIAMNNSMNDT
jgi:hypothetical protein